MPKESKKDDFWIKFNNKNLHIESNSASKVISSESSVDSIEYGNICSIEHMTITEKIIISVKAVLSSIKEDNFGAKKRITCQAYDITGKYIFINLIYYIQIQINFFYNYYLLIQGSAYIDLIINDAGTLTLHNNAIYHLNNVGLGNSKGLQL